MMYDGLFCAFDKCAMGLGTERYNGADGVSRERQDAFSALSHERAAAAIKDGKFADEIVPVSVPQRKGDPLVVDTDEGVRPETTAESLGKLRPAFDKSGTITAGNASQISDGGAAVIVMSKAKAERARASRPSGAGQLRPGGRSQPLAPAPAVPCHHSGPRQGRPHGRATSTSSRSTRRSPPSGCASAADLGISDDVVNVNGGPSPSATRSACPAPGWPSPSLLELRRRGGGTAAVSLCGGGGQGDAAVLAHPLIRPSSASPAGRRPQTPIGVGHRPIGSAAATTTRQRQTQYGGVNSPPGWPQPWAASSHAVTARASTARAQVGKP